MKRTKEQYINQLEKIFFKYNMSGSLLEKTYIDGIKNNNMTCCYIDGRIKNSKKLNQELRNVIEEFVKDYPKTIKSLYS